LIKEIDVPVRQVMIEARIVEATDNFAKNLGVRLSYNDTVPAQPSGENRIQSRIGGGIGYTGWRTGQISTEPEFFRDVSSVNLPAAGIAGAAAGQFSLILFNQAATRFLNLELSALESDGNGKVVSSPRVLTADQIEALIEQGTELPYQQATSSGATSVSFRKANLALKVKPQITPDGRVIMALDITKDSPNTSISQNFGIAIDTKHVRTDVLVDNGGTVVIGGIYTQDKSEVTSKIPVLGDLPYVGALFRNRASRDNRTELLIFITPKIVGEALKL
jgi:type IV pilus assembly protein PilQ